MNTNLLINWRSLAKRIFIFSIVLVMVFGGTIAYVDAQTGTEPALLQGTVNNETMLDPVPGGPGYVMVSVFDFTAYSPSYAMAYWGTSLYNPSNTLSTDAMAGITLPHGANIKKVTLYFFDNYVSNATLYFFRANGVNDVDLVAMVQTDGAQTEYRAVSIEPYLEQSVVDNQNYSYYLEIAIPSNALTDIRISNVRIDYEYTAAVPLIMK